MSKLSVICCSMGGNQQNADPLRPIVERLGMSLIQISEWDQHDVRWRPEDWLQELAKADIVICPQRHRLQPAKSNNRVTQAQSLGLPVCASPLLAYREAIVHGETGFLCDTPQQWEECLRLLRDSPELRRRIGQAARLSAARNYSMDVIGGRWLQLLEGLTREAGQPPSVDIIVPTWNNLQYLQECIKSVRLNTDWPHNLIVVNSGDDDTADWLSQQPDILSYNHSHRLHYSHAINVGLQLARQQYVCLLNDDTIVSQHWLAALMHEAMKPGMGGVNPFSNCDLNWLHEEAWVVDGITLYPGMVYDNVASIIPQLYTQKHRKVVTVRDWLAFYCTVIPRAVIDLAGPLDEGFQSGCEDKDYCQRIADLGYRFVTTYDSFVFHFGGTTRRRAQLADHTQHRLQDQHNHRYLARKKQHTPGSNRLAVYTGPGWERWSPLSLERGGIGGAETCVIHVAREFARRGYAVTVYGDPGSEAGIYDGVSYVPHQQFDPAQPADIFISSRQPDVFGRPINARRKVCWVHDIWLHHDREANINAAAVDKFFVLSPWHRDFFCRHHGIPPERTFLTANGIDLGRFNRPLPRVRGRMIYSSSPDRGLDVLLDCLPAIRQRVPEAHLRVFYGFDNWSKAAQLRGDECELSRMEQIKQQLRQPGVEYFGRIGQGKLADEFLQAELWGYPTAFTETFCMTAAEAMAAGVPVVTSNLAALTTTVGGAGVLIDGDNRSVHYKHAFVEVCVYLLSERPAWEEMSARGPGAAAAYDWTTIVERWLHELV